MKPVVAFALVFIGATVLRAAEQAQQWETRRWPERGRPEVIVQFRPYSEPEVSRVVRLVGIGRDRFFALAETTVAVPINVLLAASPRAYRELTDGLIPDWGAAVAIPQERLIIVALNSSSKPLDEAVAHEVSHVLLHAVAVYPVPRWFDEGLAMYLSGEWSIYDSFRLARGVLGKGLIPLSHIENVFAYQQDQAWLAYAESFGAVSWIAQQNGKNGLGRLIRLLSRESFDDALYDVTGLVGDSFERKWLQKTRHSYALAGLADDMWLWSVVIPGIFFLALAVRWWRNRQVLKRWRTDDDDDDDDEPDEPLDERIADTYG